MKRLSFAVIAVSAVSASACLQAQRPVILSLNSGPDPVGTVARLLAQEGQTPESSDQATGLVLTRWRSAGYCAHPQSAGRAAGSAITALRYVAAVGPDSLTLRLERQCCLGGSLNFGDVQVRGDCVDQDGITESEQGELNALGGRLQAALGAPRG